MVYNTNFAWFKLHFSHSCHSCHFSLFLHHFRKCRACALWKYHANIYQSQEFFHTSVQDRIKVKLLYIPLSKFWIFFARMFSISVCAKFYFTHIVFQTFLNKVKFCQLIYLKISWGACKDYIISLKYNNTQFHFSYFYKSTTCLFPTSHLANHEPFHMHFLLQLFIWIKTKN